MTADRSLSRTTLLKWGASALALAMSGAALPAWADEPANTTEVAEVVVSGYRSSLEQALSLKREQVIASDSILAEDIGNFPDLNLSESIQRIPGVALQRDAGEGRQISVRGLGPQFTRVRINGMEALTTAGGTDAAGGTNRGRSFDFNVFASDLFSAITVRKTAAAETEEGSLGATVDLRTGRPFDYHGFTLTASGNLGYNDLSGQTNPRGAFLISNTWGNGQFGALLSAAYSRRDLLDVGTSTVRWATGSAFSPGFQSATGPTLAQANAAYHPRFPRFDLYNDHQERLGATLSLQWAPRDGTTVTFDALYADFKGTREERFLEAPSFSTAGASGIGDTNVLSGVIDAQNTLVSGSFNDVDLRVEDRFDSLDTTFNQYTLTLDHRFDDRLSMNAIVGTSRSNHDNPIQTTLTLDQTNVQGYAYDYSLGRVPLITYGSANLTNPASWVLSGIRLRPQTALNTYDTAQVSFRYRFNDELTFSAGYDWKRYEFTTTELRRTNGTTANQEAVVPAGAAAIALSSYSRVVSFPGDGLGLPAGNATSWLVPDLSVAAGLLSLYDQTAFGGAFRLGPEPALGNNNSIREEDTGGYFQGDLSTQLFGHGLRANAGVRFVRTRQGAEGFSFISGAALPVATERVYTDTLPSFNLAFDVTDQVILRFAAARTMSRPNLGNLAPGVTINVSGANRTVTAGNPNLDPFRATAIDVSAEWYFGHGGLLSAAYFHKDLDSFVQTVSLVGVPFTGNPFGLPDSLATAACGATAGCSPSLNNWTFSTPQNTRGGVIEGVELSWQQPFSFLPGFLTHTGIQTNFTYVTSSIDYVNSAGAVVATNDITGLSRRSYNATLYYEDDHISTRVSVAYRSRYLTRVPGQEAGTNYDGTNATLNVDANFTYTINDHFQLSVEGINLTDEFQDQFNDSSNRVSFYHHTGRELLFGARYTY